LNFTEDREKAGLSDLDPLFYFLKTSREHYQFRKTRLLLSVTLKKLALISLILVYSLATVGVGLRQFYCCGELRSTTLALIQKASLQCSEGAEKGGCCANKFQFLKVKDKHIQSDEISSPVKQATQPDTYFISSPDLSFPGPSIVIAFRSHAPPVITGLPVYIYNCVFRI